LAEREERTVHIDVYDPEMCCATGVCGPAPDQTLIRFEETLTRLRQEGVGVTRHQLSRDPEAFVNHPVVYQQLLAGGASVLPMVAVDGALKFVGRYPAYDELRQVLTVTG
jgi:hypothetical protein